MVFFKIVPITCNALVPSFFPVFSSQPHAVNRFWTDPSKSPPKLSPLPLKMRNAVLEGVSSKLEKEKKSHGAKSGLYGGWGTHVTLIFAR